MSGKRSPALDLRHPFFRPMWRRCVVVALLLSWAIVETMKGSPFWAILVAGICAYAIYVFFFKFDNDSDDRT